MSRHRSLVLKRERIVWRLEFKHLILCKVVKMLIKWDKYSHNACLSLAPKILWVTSTLSVHMCVCFQGAWVRRQRVCSTEREWKEMRGSIRNVGEKERGIQCMLDSYSKSCKKYTSKSGCVSLWVTAVSLKITNDWMKAWWEKYF